MSGGNSEQKRQVENGMKKLLAIIIVLVMSFFGVNVFQNAEQVMLTDGELELTMIDVG